MSRNAPTIKRPTHIGEKPMSFMVPISLFVGLVTTQSITTEFLAWRLKFNSALGHALFGVLYWPWAWAGWTWQFLQPMQRMFGRPYAVYSSDVYDAFHQAPFAAAIGLLVSVATAAAVSAPKPARDDEDLYDTGSKWADEATAKKDKLLGAKAGPIIGGFDIGMGRTVPLRYEGQLGLSYVEPPGGGKSAFLITNFLIPMQHQEAGKWSERDRRLHPWGEEPVMITSDPKFELYKQTSGYQREVLGKDIFLLAPLGVGPDLRIGHDELACYNPFWSIRLGTDRGFQDTLFAAMAIVDPEGEGLKTHWDRTGLGWGAAAIEKLGYRAINIGDYESFSLPGLLEFMSSFPSMDGLLDFMLKTPDDPTGAMGWTETLADGTVHSTLVKPSIQQAAREMLNKDPRERAGVYSTFIAFLAPYRSEIMRKFITKSTFDWSSMANNKERASTVYIAMDPMDLPKLRPYLRQVFGTAVEELTSGGTMDVGGRSARGNYRPVVMPLDEIAAWKKLAEIEHGSGYFRGYGIMLWLIWQSVAQQIKYYSKDNVMNETMDVLLYGRPKTAEGAEHISKMLGDTTHQVKKRSVSGGRFNIIAPQAQDVIDAVKLPLMSAKNIMQIEKDRYLAFFNGHNYYLRKWEYFKNKTLSSRAKIPYVKESSWDSTVLPLFVQHVESALSKESLEKWRAAVSSKAGKSPASAQRAAASEAAESPRESDPSATDVSGAKQPEEENGKKVMVVRAGNATEAYMRAAQMLKQEQALRDREAVSA